MLLRVLCSLNCINDRSEEEEEEEENEKEYKEKTCWIFSSET